MTGGIASGAPDAPRAAADAPRAAAEGVLRGRMPTVESAP